MKKFKSFHVDAKTGGGTLDIFEKLTGGYFARFTGSSGLAHLKENGRKTPWMKKVEFTLDDASYNSLIEKCRAEIDKHYPEVLTWSSSMDQSSLE